MSITIEDGTAARSHLLTVSGELDIRSAPELRHRLTELLDSGVDQVVIDLREVTFVDSTALSVFVSAHKRLAAIDGRLSLVCGDGAVRRVLDITGLTSVLRVQPSVDAAISG